MKFSFMERPQFTKKIIKLLEESAYFDLQNFLLEHPDWRDVIPRLPYSIKQVSRSFIRYCRSPHGVRANKYICSVRVSAISLSHEIYAYLLRKVRWKIKGRGKRGGVRVIYYLAESDDYIIFLDIWTKMKKRI